MSRRVERPGVRDGYDGGAETYDAADGGGLLCASSEVRRLGSEAEMIQGSCHCGAVQWRFDAMPESATACNCTICRRYGVLWAYDFEGEGIHVTGPTQAYVRGKSIGFHFCPACGCVAYWRALEPDEAGRRRIAVNLRLTEPEPVAQLPIDHFDGLETFEDLPRDGRCVADYWF